LNYFVIIVNDSAQFEAFTLNAKVFMYIMWCD